MTVFFTSDTHFGDHRTISIHRRPFASVAEMDAALIGNWNSVVGDGDEIWHLGDFARRAADVPALLASLKGTKHLILGNNDAPGVATAAGWASVGHYAERVVDDVALVLCHYPFRSWNGQHRGAVDLHGHSHGRLEPLPRQYDVGVDAWGFRPVTLAAIPGAAKPQSRGAPSARTTSAPSRM